MTLKKNGFNDSDKIIVTIALWVCTLTLFVTALTLPMLPSQVSIFYRPMDGTPPETYSKYNNLLLILTSIVPVFIILLCAYLKSRNRLQNNFISIILFSVMLSISMSGVILFGINKQFDASSSIYNVNMHAIICIAVAFVMSVVLSAVPTVLHGHRALDKEKSRSSFRNKVALTADELWWVGAYGYILAAVVGAFLPGFFSYISLGTFMIVHTIVLCCAKKRTAPRENNAAE